LVYRHVERIAAAYVQSAYRKPVKQKTAMSIKKRNCDIMARNESTIKLFFSVTKANLNGESFRVPLNAHVSTTYRGKSRHAMSARLSIPTALAQAPSNQNVYLTQRFAALRTEPTRMVYSVDTENRIRAKYWHFREGHENDASDSWSQGTY
jgi:hypothetical protein